MPGFLKASLLVKWNKSIIMPTNKMNLHINGAMEIL